jgi:hypothetical protein
MRACGTRTSAKRPYKSAIEVAFSAFGQATLAGPPDEEESVLQFAFADWADMHTTTISFFRSSVHPHSLQSLHSLRRAISLTALSFIALFAASAWIHAAHAQPTSPEARRLTATNAARLPAAEKITLDGKGNEAVWQRAQVITEFFEYRPREAPSKYKTEARIAYDNDAIYFYLRAHDPDPTQIQAPLVRRDQVFGTQDFFGVYLDPTGARKFAQIFRVNAAGAIGDGIFNEDNQDEDFSPDLNWDSAIARWADGWSAEIRIPFSTMRYANPPSENWSVFIVRGITRDTQYRIANGRIPKENNCLLCYAQTISNLKDLPEGHELVLTPNVTLRSTRDRITDGDTVINRNKSDFVPSLDIKYRPTANWVIDATINPDFSQVELDAPQLAANAQFALFFPEKRPFFLEGSDILSAPLNAIYTRSITDPAWGLRATRRAAESDFTILTTKDDGGGLILLPGTLGTDVAIQSTKSVATIMRARSQWGKVSVNGLFTDRQYETDANNPTLTNRVIGADFVWRPLGAMRVRGDVLFSDTTDRRNKINGKDSASDTAALFDYNYRGKHWSFFGGVDRTGKDFRADNGFFSQVGTKHAYQEIEHKWNDVLSFQEISTYLNIDRRLSLNGALLYRQQNIGVRFFRDTIAFGAEARPYQQVRFRESGAPLKRDQFELWTDWTPATWLSNLNAGITFGDRGDVANNRIGRGYAIYSNATIRLFDRWEILPRVEESVINTRDDVPGSKTIVRDRAFQLTSVYHLTARDSIRYIQQYNGTRRAPSLYESRVTPFNKSDVVSIVYAHTRSLGTSLYIGINSSRDLDPAARFTRRINEVFLKASFALDLSHWGKKA